MNLLEFLNRYSSLILTFITIVYVWLTWKNLGVLRRTAFLERENRHLDDIKTQVAEPILSWLSGIEAILQGRQEAVLLVPGTQNLNPRQSLVLGPVIVPLVGFSRQLCEDAKTKHFAPQIERYIDLAKSMDGLAADIASFGRTVCDDLKENMQLPSLTENTVERSFIDYEEFIQGCVKYFVRDAKPEFYYNESYSDGRDFVGVQGSRAAFALYPKDRLKEWLAEALRLVEDRWHGAQLVTRVNRALNDADIVRGGIQEIQITQAIPGRCKYIGE